MILFNGKSQKWIKGFFRGIWKLLKDTISVLYCKASFVFSFVTQKIKSIYILFSSKGFSHRVYTAFADSTASSIPAFSKPLMIEDFSCFKKSYISTIHFACSGLRPLSFKLTLTSAGALPSLSCWLTFSAYHSLNILVINFFAFWLTVRSSGWNLLVRLWGTITNSKLFLAHNFFFGLWEYWSERVLKLIFLLTQIWWKYGIRCC